MESAIHLDFQFARGELPLKAAEEAQSSLESGSCRGNDFLGWLSLPKKITQSELQKINEAAHLLRQNDALVVIGIGGSYLGSRAVIDALKNPFDASFPVYFAGHQLDSLYHKRLLSYLSSRRYGVNVISKSGTTTEPGIAFRLLWNDLSKRFPESLSRLVIATTDSSRGSLKKLADGAGLQTFVIPDDVGGRFSVFTPVGLLPIAAAGFSVEKLIAGAKEMMEFVRSAPAKNNPALLYASYRNAQYASGKKIEILASYISGLHYVAEWWKQLFGESEGKEGKGIFPASVDLTSDLHSMGQWMQEAERTIFETVIDVKDQDGPILSMQENDSDGLNYLSGKTMHSVNRTALLATMEAHASGGVPCLRLEIPEVNEKTLGGLLYMFEYACGISAIMLGVNPFDQPGVEAYKNNMFRMLGKPKV